MTRIFVAGLLFILISISLMSCSPQPLAEGEITAFVDDFEKKTEYLSRRLAETGWDYYLHSTSDSLEFFFSAYRAMFADPAQLTLIKNYLSVLKNEQYRRKLELIYRQFQRGVVDYERNIWSAVTSLKSQSREASKAVFFEGNLVAPDRLRSLLGSETDRTRVREIYVALNRGNDRIAEELGPLVRKRNQVASRLGYNSYYDLMLKADGIDKTELFNLIDDLKRLSADGYRTVLDSLKNILNIEHVRDYDLFHVFSGIDEQYAAYYLADNQKALLESTVDGLGFRLRSLPIYFGAVSADADNPGRTILAIQVPKDIRIPARIIDGEQSLATFFEQAGKALYATHIEPQDFLLARPPAPCFEAGVARMISALIELNNWKLKYAGMPEPLAAASTATGKAGALYSLRKMLVDISFEYRLYTDPFADPQKVYADIFEDYMMVPLEAGVRPWADIDLVTTAVGKQNQLIGDCIAAQTYHYLRGKYGAVLDDQHTKEFLVQNYYRFGARDDWQTLLERGTGERLKADYYPGFPFD